jgi:protein-tyrosine phosphatase
MTLTTSTRELSLEIAYNVRHIGGYATSSGATTSDALVRAAGLHRLTDSGLGRLADHGIRTVVDLRSQMERERDITPDVGRFGMVRVNAPVFEQDASPVGLAGEFPGFAIAYERMLLTGRAAYRELFETIATSDGGLVFHCTAGKDRTGVAAALLLSLVGVADETIVEDFALSETLLAPVLKEWMPRMAERGITEEQGRALMASRPEDMVSTLRHVRERFGSAEDYLSDIGVAPAAIAGVRARLVD